MPDFVYFWFRRDLRLHDNTALYHALARGKQVVPVFIFDKKILTPIKDKRDRRVSFIYSTVKNLNSSLHEFGGGMCVRYGDPLAVWRQLFTDFGPASIYTNRDYEPYAIERDNLIADLCQSNGVGFSSFKDQVVFDTDDILKKDGTPYTVFTPFKNQWLKTLTPQHLNSCNSKELLHLVLQRIYSQPDIEDLGFFYQPFEYPPAVPDLEIVRHYDQTRDVPSLSGTTRLGLHLRFGTVSIREMVRLALELNDIWLSELIWREFFMMVLYHFPHVENNSFRPAYDEIPWLNRDSEFERWQRGETGYPLVDAGMRELNATGHMHNRVRMVTASFLCKHLLIDWRWGERYFAEKLLDYDFSANNGNWQWSAGTGCDAAPYFRVFNPTAQQKKFDPEFKYIKKWVPEYGTSDYPSPMIDHAFARQRAIEVYRETLKK